MKITAEDLFSKLVKDYKIIGEQGKISFQLKDLTIAIETRDTVGNLLQEWLKQWMIKHKVEFSIVPNTQDFPDFHLNPDDLTKGLLEVKSFDYDRSPNFDVANFLAYRRSVIEHPYRLNSSYLIIGYRMTGNNLEIVNVWLKKVWEITGSSENWPLKCQVKQGEVVNIRPIKWYKNDRTKFKPFKSLKEFLTAFDANQRQWVRTQRDPVTSTWLKTVERKYNKLTD